MVLADGSFVTASETENADLLWALRGGGGNFGVVTSFLFHTHPAGMIYGGPIIFDLPDAAAVLRWYREFQANAPDEFYIFLGLEAVPAGDPFPKERWNKKICVLLVSHNGSTADSEKAVNAIRAALPKPIIDWAGPMPYPALQSMFNKNCPRRVFSGTGRAIWLRHCRTRRSTRISPAHAELPSAFSCMHLYPIDGAVHRQKKDAAAWGYRDAVWSMVIAGIDPDPANAPALKQWAQAYWAAVHPFNLPGAYANFMMDDQSNSSRSSAYGGNYDRLAAQKEKYDPANLFHVNQNIRPTA